MNFDIMFILNSALLGVGLAVDAFSVSITNGIVEPNMKVGKRIGIASCYAIFQFAMPLLGWLAIHTIAKEFTLFEHFIPWIALILLSIIGGKMIIEYLKDRKKDYNEILVEETPKKELTFWVIIIQGIATSIDALSVGFVNADYTFLLAFLSSLIINIVTLIICLVGLFFGEKLGKILKNKANLLGGLVLVGIGLEIFIKGIINLYF